MSALAGMRQSIVGLNIFTCLNQMCGYLKLQSLMPFPSFTVKKGIESLELLLRLIWKNQSEDFREENKRFVRVNSTGHAGFFVPTITATICAIDVQKFPFDKQECPIKLMSQAFSPNEYNIDIGLSPEIDTGTMAFENMGNGEWELRNVSVNIKEYESDLEQFSYKMNTFVVSMERNPQFYITMVILPSFVINILSIYGVFLKSADSMGKLGMALTNIMSLTFILGILATALPKTKGLPRIAIYVMVNLFIMVLALLATVILPYVNWFVSNRNEFSEKSSEKRKRNINRMSWIIEYGMIALLELANLINFIVLVG
ncbi:unnamed protein product [Cylicocyclus nassatus]|uniref:Neurotransmitter-gated ion-channel ligand-binding domain-containing protein n=1 Tax=Cylicocyclus nassatus TaxID=53992 RepID=A0AA36MA08_CYLNA|nr:unnamed protein product [Cylicocyclus nassatus]